MFQKVLIANRGAIATRVIDTLNKLGVASVAVFAESDRNSKHVAMATESFSLGDGPASDTYLDQQKIINIAKQTNAQAIHPGYGFLSENPDFVQQCETAGIAFIGPTVEQINSFGLKHTARSLAEQNDVPLLKGSDLLKDATEAKEFAENIGYPVILKSTAGGGGIGMQICYSEDEISKAFESVKRLGQNNFSNDGIFVEKYIQHARHIEVQVFGDGQGNIITLGERDCSSQRRNQKVIEEAPAPGLTEATRAALADVSRKLMSAVNYRNAGTVEFIYDMDSDQFYFLEVNTRLQVEHGVTEQIFSVDLVSWMVQLAAGELKNFTDIQSSLKQTGHAIQVRVYAEDPNKNFQPSAGLLTEVKFPDSDNVRINNWIAAGIEVSPYFDPMLAKVIVTEPDRETAIAKLIDALESSSVYGVETNINYVHSILTQDIFKQGKIYTRYLNDYKYQPNTIDIIVSGTQTTIQDTPGRLSYWDVGIPPSGPFDSYSFRLANKIVGNADDAAGLEITINGPKFKVNNDCVIAVTGAAIEFSIDGVPATMNTSVSVTAGQVVKLGKISNNGARAYLAVSGGFECPTYLGSKSTFTLGQFGGHAGRALLPGDVLHIGSTETQPCVLPQSLIPKIKNHWTIRVTYGPHAAPDFFTDNDIDTFFDTEWKVHYNSSRTGVRLIGPKPEWARENGGEAGLHPSNIHDNAYAIGAVDFTGDMPVILGPDGPSLGGFVCPVTVISADLWKMGQLKAGDKITFEPVSYHTAIKLLETQETEINNLSSEEAVAYDTVREVSPIIHTLPPEPDKIDVVYRQSGDANILIEYGPLELDISVRFRVHALMLQLKQKDIPGVIDITPGIRSVQVHFDPLILSRQKLIDICLPIEKELDDGKISTVKSRIVHLPLSWDDEACRLAIQKYTQSVRKDAPWCPSNIEFIRRINGLNSVQGVKDIVFNANYLVMGLGDVYLGAPVATPIDPRHRLVTTKYNPARTWTAENSVGIGGAYLCVYGMEGPGGYQFVGRTIQMWNRYVKTAEFSEPWLLRFFDQIKFYEVSADELKQFREDFPQGRYPLKIEETTFDINDYTKFLQENNSDISTFINNRDEAFNDELERWVASGQINFSVPEDAEEETEATIAEGHTPVESPVTGSVWKILVEVGDKVEEDQPIAILESMKMEIELGAPCEGVITELFKNEGQAVKAGQPIAVLEEKQ